MVVKAKYPKAFGKVKDVELVMISSFIYIYINITHKMFSYIYIYILIIEVHVFLQVFNECTTDMDFVVCSVTCYYFFFQCLYVLGESSI